MQLPLSLHNRNWAFVLGSPLVFALVAFRKRSVDKSGAIGGFVVALCCALAGAHFFAALLWFFVTSTLLTRFGSKRKKQVEEGYNHDGQRNAVQAIQKHPSLSLGQWLGSERIAMRPVDPLY